MDFGLTEEQVALRATLAAFLVARAPVGGARAALDGGAAFDPAVWRELAGDLGIAGLDVPEELGGAGGSTLDLVVAAEVLGAGLYGGPFLATTGLAVGALLEAGADETVGRLVAGERVAALVDGDVRVRDGRVLDGAADRVLHGATADVLVVVARDPADREVLALVDAAAAEIVPRRTLDATRPLAGVAFAATAAAVVGPLAGGGWRDRAAAVLAAEALGNATAAFDSILAHLRTREQFGRPIGAFQALQHRCADLGVQLELARTAVLLAAWEVATGGARARFAAAAALIAAGRAAHDVARASVQLHGGLGFTWEHDAHLRLRRAEVDRLLLAGEGELLDRCFAASGS